MPNEEAQRWCPFRPGAEDLQRIAADVAEIGAIQQRALAEHAGLAMPDRVAHQYQIAGSRVLFEVAEVLPAAMRGVGLFVPCARHSGIGRLSTGLGTPHVEPNPDFLGLLLAFQTTAGRRVDFLAINHPASPADDHRNFISILHATGVAAGVHVPLLGALGARDLVDLAATQTVFGASLARRVGLSQAGRTMVHLVKQTATTFRSSTAWQPYWTGIVELGGEAGKFTFVPTADDNPGPGLHPGERVFSAEWRARQQEGDVEFRVYWIAWLDEARTPTAGLTCRWEEHHKEFVGRLVFPQADPDSEEARLWAMLAAEMGGNPGNWVADPEQAITRPSTEFGIARQLAYAASQEGRGALAPERYREAFETGRIGAELAQELRRRRDEKARAGHVDGAL